MYETQFILVDGDDRTEVRNSPREIASIPEVGNTGEEGGNRLCEVQSVEDLREDDSTELDLRVEIERIERPEPEE